jgi:hypothetical protein
MATGLIVFTHQNGLHDYFKEAFKVAVEKVCSQFQIDILEWTDEQVPLSQNDLDLVQQVFLRSGTLSCKYPYLHSLMEGVAGYFQNTVQDCNCIYKMIN